MPHYDNSPSDSPVTAELRDHKSRTRFNGPNPGEWIEVNSTVVLPVGGER